VAHARCNRPNGAADRPRSFAAEAEPLQRDATPAKQRLILVGMRTMSTTHRPIKGLREIGLRVEDLDTMQRFYKEVIGLELIKRFENGAFLKLADGYDGHTQVIALFDRKAQAGYVGLDPLKDHRRPHRI
jgi:hypothetical protein